MSEAMEVISGTRQHAIIQGDCLDLMRQLPDNCVSLVMTSPPYEKARTYGIDFKLSGQAWVDWCVERYLECLRVCKGLVAWVVEGQTKGFRWTATPALLMADLHRRGVHLRKPPAFCRVGIPGSGGPDWWRNDYEFIVCATNGGKLPWSDNTATGHPPKWAPGGEMSHRLADGARVNQWGTHIDENGLVSKGGQDGATGKRAGRVPMRPSHKFLSMTSRGANGERKIAGGRRVTRGTKDGDTETSDSYEPPTLANPGNVIEPTYTADEVRALLARCGVTDEAASELVRCKVGGGLMGSDLAHANEAPYPTKLVEPFVLSFCPPDGICLDPFSGSGTTAAVAVRLGRRAIGIDVRQSQVDLGRRRLAEVQPELWT